MTNIIDILIEEDIPFAVAVGNLTLSRGLNMHVKEYYLIAMISDFSYLRELGFRKGDSLTTRMRVVEKAMDEDEIAYFKEINDQFIKVMQRRDVGRVYEFKRKPFKKCYVKNRCYAKGV